MPFRDEAMQLMAHEHPGLVKCFDFGIAEKRPFSILEWLDGGTLAQVLKRKKSMSVADSLQTALSICDGLLFLQENGLHHEDLKTTDVMWLTSNKVKLIDLGRRRSIGHLNETAPLGELSAPILLIPRRKCWRVSTPTY